MTTPKAIIAAFLSLWMLAVQDVPAQRSGGNGTDAAPSCVGEWYGGIEGGVPFGMSTFSSFGADKTRAGYALGLFGGYRFHPALSAELSAKWGKANLAARNCCAESSYWLGADGRTYHAPVAGFAGADYADLKSAVALQQYGVRLNVNLLGFFRRTRQSRWRLELSPTIAAVGTKADVQTIAAGNSLSEGRTRWHLAGGGDLQASYAVTDRLQLGVYSGITCLSGRGMDGVAPRVHDVNCLWESGLRIGYTFSRSRRKAQAREGSLLPVVETPVALPDTATVRPEPEEEPQVTPVETPVTDMPETAQDFPVIYFDFNKSNIRAEEMEKLRDICHILQTHPDMRVSITGWCDPAGSIAVNRRISRRRAEAVRDWLVSQGIEASRLEVLGMGIDRDETDAAKARRVVVVDNERKEAQP